MPEVSKPAFSEAELEEVVHFFRTYRFKTALAVIRAEREELVVKLDAMIKDLRAKGWDVCTRCGKFKAIGYHGHADRHCNACDIGAD